MGSSGLRPPASGSARPVLGIETSCDETAAAVVRGGRALSNVVWSQAAIHARFGGVVPEMASRAHAERIGLVIARALSDAKIRPEDLGGLAATFRPGLVGSLLVGLSAAKGMALALKLPLAGVDHLAAHLYAGLMAAPDLELPAVGLVASGGHTDLFRFESPTSWTLLGGTVDDAAGECLDKTANLLGLPYPGGPNLEKLAAGGDPRAIRFPRPFLDEDSPRMSFSGIKTAALYRLKGQDAGRLDANVETAACPPDRTPTGRAPDLRETASRRAGPAADIAASVQAAVVEVLVAKTIAAARREGVRSVIAGGGVTANAALRSAFESACAREGLRLVIPPKEWCTDNAAMIAGLGEALLAEGRDDGMALAASPS